MRLLHEGKMNFLPKTEVLSLEEIERLCDNFIDLGVEKIQTYRW